MCDRGTFVIIPKVVLEHTNTHAHIPYVYLFVLTAAMPALPLSILGQARPGQREFPFFYVQARSELVHIKAELLLALRLNLIKICFACFFICRKYTNTPHYTHTHTHTHAQRGSPAEHCAYAPLHKYKLKCFVGVPAVPCILLCQ